MKRAHCPWLVIGAPTFSFEIPSEQKRTLAGENGGGKKKERKKKELRPPCYGVN
jgi:hypothetical protein